MSKNTKDIHQSEYLNVKETALFLNEKESFVRSMVFNRKIPYVKLNRSIRFIKKDLIKWYETKIIKIKE